jgi:hypothetical protein
METFLYYNSFFSLHFLYIPRISLLTCTWWEFDSVLGTVQIIPQTLVRCLLWPKPLRNWGVSCFVCIIIIFRMTVDSIHKRRMYGYLTGIWGILQSLNKHTANQ